MLKGFGHDTTGAVLVEFALCLPVLLVMYLGTFVITDMVTCNRKVTIATRALTDLASHNLSPTAIQQNPASASAAAYLSAAAVVMNPYSMARTTQGVSLLRVCDASHAYLVWSQTMTQDSAGNVLTAPTTTGTPTAASVIAIPATMVTTPSIPVNPDGSTGICTNYSASSATRTQLGQAGGYIFAGKISFAYTPPVGLGPQTITPMSDAIYMSPRLY